MNEAEPTAGPDASEHGARRRGFRWGVGISVLLELVISVPSLAIEETWHGRPMIDQRSALWIVPALLVAAAFVAGGAIAGYRRPAGAAVHATGAASIAVVLLLSADAIRRFWLEHESVSPSLARLWYVGAAAALLLSAAGSRLGRLLSLRTGFR